MIGSDFIKAHAPRGGQCGECGASIAPGATCLESRRGGKVRKRVCSETCRLDFDHRYWQERADRREQAGRA
jgi:hypothetical protein